MGQYWIPVNLDKREFIDPHKLGAGLKLWEQMANHPGTGAALVALLAAMPEARGGGDLTPNKIVGRWAGDRVVLIGDYAEDGDIANSAATSGPSDPPASFIYAMCHSEEYGPYPDELKTHGEPFKDITAEVCAVIENELGGKYIGDVWRSFRYNDYRQFALEEQKVAMVRAALADFKPANDLDAQRVYESIKHDFAEVAE